MIELENVKGQLFNCAVGDLELVKTKAKAQEVEAETKAQKTKDQEPAIEAEAKTLFSIEEAKLKAEIKLLELSKCASSVSSNHNNIT